MDNFVDWCISTFIWIITNSPCVFLLIYPIYASPSSSRTLPLFGLFTKHFATKFWENILIGNFASRSLIWDISRPDLENSIPFVLQTFRHWTFCCWTFRCRTFHCQIFCCLTFRCRICRTFRCWLFNFGYFVIVPFNHCSGSLTFWYGSESADPYHGSGSCLFFSDIQNANRK